MRQPRFLKAGALQYSPAGCQVRLQDHMAFAIIKILPAPIWIHDVDAAARPRRVDENCLGIDAFLGKLLANKVPTKILTHITDESSALAQASIPSTGIPASLAYSIQILGEVCFDVEIYLRPMQINICVDACVSDNDNIQRSVFYIRGKHAVFGTKVSFNKIKLTFRLCDFILFGCSQTAGENYTTLPK
jgi:hypothetical protein